MNNNNITHKMFLSLMIPFILSTITQPLLGAADIAVVGKLNNVNYISGVSIGTLIFNTIYWIFGFLRVSTTAFSAQSSHYSDKKRVSDIFFRPIMIALFISLIMVIFQNIIFESSMKFIKPELEIEKAAITYFKILIWGAPFVLTNYVLLGWLMGLGNIKASMTMQISGNLLNIILDIIFVTVFNFKVEGVAYATLISQIFSTFLGVYFIFPYTYHKYIDLKSIINKKELISIFCVNRDLMVRTICLVSHNNLFTMASSNLGGDILATNAILFQIMSIISYAFDGIANTASVFAGRARGQKDNLLMKNCWKKTFYWGVIFVILTTVIYLIFSDSIIRIFTKLPNIILLAKEYSKWILLYPSIAFLGLTFYGVFTGSAKTFPIMTSTIIAFILFFISWKYLIPLYENNGVWISLLVFYFGRGVFLIPQLKKTLS
ncbi:MULTISPECIES: MATE family efflux transporter [Fusobacterium]|uniref:MATE family efflux transporter n=1 Tax=Fusobacterium mortiferum TaxID=850 RepID=A0A414PUK2_FUSMR|nr:MULTISPECIES: MATE family efflux transporter [Fusobacterium]MCF2628039.1 MATE family efflux transporter [Fusobacterium mortiferum]MCF2698624.1 MATE family efflux transporter [Fusobacterium mortiferum]MCI6382311.1 MATE family efflux transporter [Fusobacterium mortiferum]MCI7665761.1 MATE family efflux transporter [Fusobacterium mortiferum]MDD7262776.1 MATE family efflux transporter [Fusobacterium mortiferum]